jgi:hypothetical protein
MGKQRTAEPSGVSAGEPQARVPRDARIIEDILRSMVRRAYTRPSHTVTVPCTLGATVLDPPTTPSPRSFST